MQITRFVATGDGGSRFEDVEIPLDNEREGAGGYTLMCSEMFSSAARSSSATLSKGRPLASCTQLS